MEQDSFFRYEWMLRESVTGAKDKADDGDMDAHESLLAFARLTLDGKDPEGEAVIAIVNFAMRFAPMATN